MYFYLSSLLEGKLPLMFASPVESANRPCTVPSGSLFCFLPPTVEVSLRLAFFQMSFRLQSCRVNTVPYLTLYDTFPMSI
jgi:hypothetical protein